MGQQSRYELEDLCIFGVGTSFVAFLIWAALAVALIAGCLSVCPICIAFHTHAVYAHDNGSYTITSYCQDDWDRTCARCMFHFHAFVDMTKGAVFMPFVLVRAAGAYAVRLAFWTVDNLPMILAVLAVSFLALLNVVLTVARVLRGQPLL